MALLFLDSYDHHGGSALAAKYATNSGGGINGSSGRRSSQSLVCGSGDYVLTRTLPVSGTTAIVGVGIKYVGGVPGSTSAAIAIRSGATAQVTFAFNSSGYGVVYRGTTAGTLLGTTSAIGASTSFVFVELSIVIHASAGTVSVRFDGAEVLSLTGQNTAATGSALWDVVQLGNGAVQTTFDDLYILDGSGAAPLNAVLGDCRVDARYPTAEGASSAWTPLSGSDNALMVDETSSDDDTTYNSTATVNATDTHVVQDAAVAGGTIYGVQLCILQKKTDSGTCSIAPVVRHSSTDYPGTATNPTTSYAYALQPYGTNPGTSAAWTEADFNAAEFGYKRTA